MRGQKMASILEEVAARAIPGDVDLWPALQPRLRFRRRSPRSLRGKLVAGAKVLAVACIAFAVIFAISPEVRAQTGLVIRKVGDLVFSNALPRPQAATIPSNVLPPDFPYVGHSEGMTLAEARAAVPFFSFDVPTWAPEDFYADDQVGLYTVTSKDCNCVVAWTVSKVWIKPAPMGHDSGYGSSRIAIELSVSRGEQMWDMRKSTFPTDLATLEQLTVNGRPTALLGPLGVMPAEPRLLTLSKTLMWTKGDLVYSLYGSPGVPVQDLIRMAETIP